MHFAARERVRALSKRLLCSFLRDCESWASRRLGKPRGCVRKSSTQLTHPVITTRVLAAWYAGPEPSVEHGRHVQVAPAVPGTEEG